jgi:hypothetical protein
MECDQDRMARVVAAIAQNEVIITRLEEVIRSSVRMDPLLVDASTCTIDDFAATAPMTMDGAVGMESDVRSFLSRPHIGLLKLQLTLDREKRLLEEERQTFFLSVSRLQQSALALRSALLSEET